MKFLAAKPPDTCQRGFFFFIKLQKKLELEIMKRYANDGQSIKLG